MNERSFLPPLEYIRKAAEKTRSNWRGEAIVAERANRLQSRIDCFQKSEESRRDFQKNFAVYGNFVLDKKRQNSATDKEIYLVFLEVSDTKGNSTFETLDIKTEYLSSFDGKNEKFRKKALDYIEKESQDDTVAYLFYKVRESFGGGFNREKELRQIKAVEHMLMGDHVAMVTGDGKTSVVIPIYTIAHNLFFQLRDNALPDIVVSSADSTLTADIADKVEKHALVLKEIARDLPEIAREELERRIKTLPKSMRRYETKGNKKGLGGFFAEDPQLLAWDVINGAKIGSRVHEQVIFESVELYAKQIDEDFAANKANPTGEDPTKNAGLMAQKILPIWVFDEAHLTDQAPYTTDKGRTNDEGKTEVNLEYNSDRLTLVNYLTLRIAQETVLDTQNCVSLSGQQLELTAKGRKNLITLRRRIIEEIDTYLANKRKNTKLIRQLNSIIKDEIGENCEFSQPDYETELLRGLADFWSHKDRYLDSLHELLKDEGGVNEFAKRSEKISTQDQYLFGLVNAFLATTSMVAKGVDYIKPDLLRDRLRGTLLAGRRFSGEVPFHINLAEGKPLIEDEKRLFNQIDFHTWLKLIAQGNIVALSNDLYYTDPTTGERVMSPLGEMLEKYTDGYVVDLAPKKEAGEIFPFPQPILVEGEKNLINSVSSDILARLSQQGARPEMVVCWDESTGNAIYREMIPSGRRLGLITSMTSDEEADRIHFQFSNGEIDVLVTTGRKSFAADFKDSQGQFTDMRVNVINSETVFQIHQAFGRRRLEKHEADFSIYFEKNFLLDLSTILEQEEKKSPLIFKKTNSVYPEVEELVNKHFKRKLSPTELGKIKKDIITILKKNQRKNIGDLEKNVEFEEFFIQTVSPYIRDLKWNLVEGNWRKASSPMHTIIEEELAAALRKSGLEDIPFKFHKDLENAARGAVLDYFSSLEENIYKDYKHFVFMEGKNPLIASNTQALKGRVYNEMKKLIDETYRPIWSEQLGERDGQFLQRELRKRLREAMAINVGLIEFVNNQLKTKNLNMKDVREIYPLFSPLYEPDPNNGFRLGQVPNMTPVILACHNQQLIEVKGRRYIFDELTGTYRPVDHNSYELKLLALNGLVETNPFSEGRFVDFYYPSGNNGRFVRVGLRERER